MLWHVGAEREQVATSMSQVLCGWAGAVGVKLSSDYRENIHGEPLILKTFQINSSTHDEDLLLYGMNILVY